MRGVFQRIRDNIVDPFACDTRGRGRTEEARSTLYAASQKGLRIAPERLLTARLAAIEGDIEGLEALVTNRPNNTHPSSSRETYVAALVAYLKHDFNSAREIISGVKT